MAKRKRRIRHDPIVAAFGERLRDLRAARNMTQRDLADRARITLSYVSRLEAGGASPGLDLMQRIAQALVVKIPDLVPMEPEPEIEDRRKQVKDRLDGLIALAGGQTLLMLDLLLRRIEGSPEIAQ